MGTLAASETRRNIDQSREKAITARKRREEEEEERKGTRVRTYVRLHIERIDAYSIL